MSKPPKPTELNPFDPHAFIKGHAPTPFTAAQIRLGCPTGRKVTTRTEVPGEPAVTTSSTFVETDDHGAVILNDDGSSSRVTWEDLQRHASFPADEVRVANDVIDTALGTLQCLRYTVERGKGFDTFWFAFAHPGMPVLYTSEEDGQVTSTSTVISSEMPPASETG